jgi:hypothetical protein
VCVCVVGALFEKGAQRRGVERPPRHGNPKIPYPRGGFGTTRESEMSVLLMPSTGAALGGRDCHPVQEPRAAPTGRSTRSGRRAKGPSALFTGLVPPYRFVWWAQFPLGLVRPSAAAA